MAERTPWDKYIDPTPEEMEQLRLQQQPGAPAITPPTDPWTKYIEGPPVVVQPVQPEAPRTWWDTLASGAQTADDFVRAAANAATFGMADRFAGYMGGEGTAAEAKKTEQARERSPIATTTGDVAGAVALPGFGGAKLATGLGSSLGARALGYGLEGGLVGAAQGAGNTYTGNPEDYATNAAKGFAFGAPAGAIMGGVFGPRAATTPTPTLAEQRAAETRAYNALAANPTRYDPAAFRQAADTAERTLQKAGHSPDAGFSPASFKAVDQMRNLDEVTPATIDMVRKGLGLNARQGADAQGAKIVRKALDDFTMNPPAGAVLTSPQIAQDAAQLATIARGLHGGAERTELLANIRTNAENIAATNPGGANVNELIQRQIRSDLLNPKSSVAQKNIRSFNPEERQALQATLDKWPTLVRGAGTALGGNVPFWGLALGGTGIGYGLNYLGVDPKVAGAAGMAAALSGKGLRYSGNQMLGNRITRAEDLIAQRNPQYQYDLSRGITVPGSGLSAGTTQSLRNAITQALISNTAEGSGAP